MSPRVRTAIATIVVLVLLVASVLIPHPLEGPVLFSITDDHGVHLGDLLGVAVAAAVLRLVAGRRRQGADRVDRPDRRQRSLQ